ncbi:MAG TPA: hypothetical protein VLE23_04520, partial [Geminicoccaceae bacterium]|nr:hypothetical protein [Geminicoccaceae bacterium]
PLSAQPNEPETAAGINELVFQARMKAGHAVVDRRRPRAGLVETNPRALAGSRRLIRSWRSSSGRPLDRRWRDFAVRPGVAFGAC